MIYDLETTGLSPDFDEIIQVAAVRFRNGAVSSSEMFFSYARPRRPLPSFITSYTGITSADVARAPRPDEVVREFARFVDASGLIAHNGHRFDSKFLEAACRRHGLAVNGVYSIDSIQLSRRVFGTVAGAGHGLDRVLARLGISGSRFARHDARGDVELLGRAVERMWSRLGLDAQGSGIRGHATTLPMIRSGG